MSGGEERQVIGQWRDGSVMYEHPTEDEILAHYDELIALCSMEQKNDLNMMRDAKITTFFRNASQGKTEDEAIDLAIQFWYQQYPWEVKEFVRDMKVLRETLIDPKGFSSDKDKAMLLTGRMPTRIKELLMAYSVHFFDRDKNGRCKNIDKFYARFKVGKVRN